MAYYMPYASQGFCNPSSMVQIPHVQHEESMSSISSWFDLGTPSVASQDPTIPLDLQYVANIELSIPGIYEPSSNNNTGFQTLDPAPPPIPSAQPCHISPSILLQFGERFFTSQPNTNPSHALGSISVMPNLIPSASSTPSEEDRIVPVCHRDHAKERSATASWTGRRPPSRVSKRHSPYPCANHSVASPSPVPEPTPPTRKRKRPSPTSSPPPSSTPKSKKPRTTPSLPDTLQPIRIIPASGALPRCPMPRCGVSIEACDAAWRGHFKAVHHDDLCLTPGCAGLPSPTCKARCPCPIAGGRGNACERMMGIESVGRHLLNIHIGVAHRCPVCGMERKWRESACARHIRLCLRREKDEKQRDGH